MFFLNTPLNLMEKKYAIAVGVGYLVLLTIVWLMFRNKHVHFKRYGYVGIFLFCLVSNISILIPMGAAVSVLAGRLYNPLVVGILAALGSILGEILAYNVGSAGTVFMEHARWYETVKYYTTKNGFLTFFAVSSVPTPFFNFGAMMAGAVKYPLLQFLIASFSGNWLQYTALAFFGQLTTRIV